MKTFVVVVAAVVTLTAVGFTFESGSEPSQEKAKPKYTIKQVMKAVHKDGLQRTVSKGKATQEEKLLLLEYYVALYENKPPKGEEASWKKLSAQAMAAAAKLVVDPKAKGDILKAATNCKACHDPHKP